MGGVDAGEFLVEALEGESELIVVQAQLVENGGVEVADADFVFDDIVGILVGLAMSDAAFDPAAGHPGGKALRVMIAAILLALKLALAESGAAKLTGEDDEGVFKHAALFEVVNETGAGLVDVISLPLDLFWEFAVVVPAAVKELNETDATLGHAAREEAVAGKRAGLFNFRAVEFFVEHLVLASEIGELGH